MESTKIVNPDTGEVRKIVSAFVPCDTLITPEEHNVHEEDIVELTIVKSYKKDEEGKIIVVEEQIETNRYNRQDYIESFDSDCGIQNILKKIGEGVVSADRYAGDKAGVPAGEQDFTPLANVENFADIVALADKARATYDNLDPDLRKGMSFEKFVESFTNKDLNDYVQKKTQPKKEGE